MRKTHTAGSQTICARESKRDISRRNLKAVLSIWHSATSPQITYAEAIARAQKRCADLRTSLGSVSQAISAFKRKHRGRDPRQVALSDFLLSVPSLGHLAVGGRRAVGVSKEQCFSCPSCGQGYKNKRSIWHHQKHCSSRMRESDNDASAAAASTRSRASHVEARRRPSLRCIEAKGRLHLCNTSPISPAASTRTISARESKRDISRRNLKAVLSIWHSATSPQITYAEAIARAQKRCAGLRTSLGSVSQAISAFKRKHRGRDPRQVALSDFLLSVFVSDKIVDDGGNDSVLSTSDGDGTSVSDGDDDASCGSGESGADKTKSALLPVDFLVDRCLGYAPGVSHKVVLYRFRAHTCVCSFLPSFFTHCFQSRVQHQWL
jgi:hypothetical protein